MKKWLVNPENRNGGIEVEMTPEEENAFNESTITGDKKKQAMLDAKEAREALKASAKGKLIAGEALTEEEANTIVI